MGVAKGYDGFFHYMSLMKSITYGVSRGAVSILY